MLELRDFFHLPQVDAAVQRLCAEDSGLIVVAGCDPRPEATPIPEHGFLPSGRLTIFRILVRQILASRQPPRAIIVTTNPKIIRIPRKLRRDITVSRVKPPMTYPECLADAARRRPQLLVIDRLDAGTVPAALRAAREGTLVLSQLDTIFRGADVARHMLDIGAPRELIQALTWVITVGRMATLCPNCKQPAPPDPLHLAALRGRYPMIDQTLDRATFFRAAGCPDCHHTGRSGDVAAYDIFRADVDASRHVQVPNLLPLEAYVLGLAAHGLLPIDDIYRLDANQLRRTYNQLTASERALADTNAELRRRLAELEAANRVLQGRTEALISLHDIGQALIASTGLDDLGVRVCRRAGDLCGADRAILYYLRSDETLEVLAATGWDPSLVRQRFSAQLVLRPTEGTEPVPFTGLPPGVPRDPRADARGAALRAGLRVPLLAQGALVGLMIVHTTHRSRFTQGQVALLQTFANQAAVAIQRAGLIEQLRIKIDQLKAAQTELVEKERMEREMELARQVQQSVLPRIFPLMPGYGFGACNRPARRVGGDFYDVILLDGDHFGLVIADVSDKGMPAALYMALTRSLLLAEARRERSPRAVLNNVHRLLLELGQPDMFVTVFYGVVNGPARRLTYARAGHDRPLLLHSGTATRLGGEGIFLGFPDLHQLNLSEETIALHHGDRLILYTDGLTDILSPAGQAFGSGRLESTLLSHAHLPPTELCEATFADLTAYRGDAEQYDDMAMLAVEIK